MSDLEKSTEWTDPLNQRSKVFEGNLTFREAARQVYQALQTFEPAYGIKSTETGELLGEDEAIEMIAQAMLNVEQKREKAAGAAT